MFLSIQYLRAFAAVAVVIFHLASKLSLSDLQDRYLGLGASGVDIFFIISGFVMNVSTTRDDGPLQFYKKRILRIVPLYYLVTAAVIAVLAWSPSLAVISRLNATHVAASLAFMPWPHPGWPTKLWPVVVPGWTLNYEMFFYFLLGLALLAPRRIRGIILAMTIALLVLAGVLFEPDGVLQFYCSPLLLEFLSGYWLARVLRATPPPGPRVIAALVFGAIGVWATLGPMTDPPDWSRTLWWGIPSLMLVAAAVSLDRRRLVRHHALLSFLGDASYSIYLAQFLAVAGFNLIWRWFDGPQPSGLAACLFMVVGTVVVTLSGTALFVAVERPILRYFQNRFVPGQRLSAPV